MGLAFFNTQDSILSKPQLVLKDGNISTSKCCLRWVGLAWVLRLSVVCVNRKSELWKKPPIITHDYHSAECVLCEVKITWLNLGYVSNSTRSKAWKSLYNPVQLSVCFLSLANAHPIPEACPKGPGSLFQSRLSSLGDKVCIIFRHSSINMSFKKKYREVFLTLNWVHKVDEKQVDISWQLEMWGHMWAYG